MKKITLTICITCTVLYFQNCVFHSQVRPTGTVPKWYAALRVRTCCPQPSFANWDRSKMECCYPSQDLLSTANFGQLGPFQNGMLLSESGLAVHSQVWPTGTVPKWYAAIRVRSCCPQPTSANWDSSKMACCSPSQDLLSTAKFGQLGPF